MTQNIEKRLRSTLVVEGVRHPREKLETWVDFVKRVTHKFEDIRGSTDLLAGWSCTKE